MSKFGQNSVGIQEKSARIHWKFSIFGIAHHFLEYSAKFREILIKIDAKFDEKQLKNSDFLQNFGQKSEKVSRNFAEILKLNRCKGLQIL